MIHPIRSFTGLNFVAPIEEAPNGGRGEISDGGGMFASSDDDDDAVVDLCRG
jgi:hypothetical protein